MSCRQSLTAALRQCQSGVSQQQWRALSTSAPVAAVRHIPVSTNRAKRTRSSPNESLLGLLTEGLDRGSQLTPQQESEMMEQQNGRGGVVRDLRISATTDSYMKQMPRRWRTGEVYAPKDLSATEMSKWRTARKPKQDIVDMLGINPLDNYRNFSLISEFITPMGRIKHSHDTGLRPVNQRKMAKAIRRAIGMGLHPSVHRHPEIMRFSKASLPQSAVPSASSQQNRL